MHNTYIIHAFIIFIQLNFKYDLVIHIFNLILCNLYIYPNGKNSFVGLEKSYFVKDQSILYLLLQNFITKYIYNKSKDNNFLLTCYNYPKTIVLRDAQVKF